MEHDTEREALESLPFSETYTKAQHESRRNARRRRIHRQWRESGLNEDQISARQDNSVEQMEMRKLVSFRRALVFVSSHSHD